MTDIARYEAFEKYLYERSIRKGGNPTMSTQVSIPIRKNNRANGKILGWETIYFSNHPDCSKRGTKEVRYGISD